MVQYTITHILERNTEKAGQIFIGLLIRLILGESRRLTAGITTISQHTISDIPLRITNDEEHNHKIKYSFIFKQIRHIKSNSDDPEKKLIMFS